MSRTDIEIKQLHATQVEATLDLFDLAFGHSSSSAERESERVILDDARMFGAFDGDLLVGTTVSLPLEMTVPGSTLGVAGVTGVGVLPTHRRRGILSALMRHQLADLHDTAAEPVATLWATEPQIYPRYGYGFAVRSLGVEVPRERAQLQHTPAVEEVTLRYVAPGELGALAGGVFDREVSVRPGAFRRDARWWRRAADDPPEGRDGASELRGVVAERHGDVVGYAMFRTKAKWTPNGPHGAVLVKELYAVDPASYARVLEFVLNQDLMAVTRLRNRPVDDPLLDMLADPRRTSVDVNDALWVRLVDVDRALASRRYYLPVDVVIEVDDPVCPWNTGCWRLTGNSEDAKCERVDDDPDLVVHIDDLGAVYLGGRHLSRLAAAGRVQERHPGTLGPASQSFAWDPAPWCQEIF
ncbi:MAG TPA: GNAT family N-acetyltransferase [Nocardioidaceae bacterium]|nr:GNAT family N-acetyltransferase [Nocardioidaceae bacterium]